MKMHVLLEYCILNSFCAVVAQCYIDIYNLYNYVNINIIYVIDRT